MKKIIYSIIIITFLSCTNDKTITSTGIEIINIADLKPDGTFNPSIPLLDYGKITGDKPVSKIIKIRNLNKEPLFFEKVDSKIIKLVWDEMPIKQNETRQLKLILDPNYIDGTNYAMFTIPEKNGKSLTLGYKYEANVKDITYQVESKKISLNENQNSYDYPIKNTGSIAFKITSVTSNKQNLIIDFPKETIKINENGNINIEFPNDTPKTAVEVTVIIDKTTDWPQDIGGKPSFAKTIKFNLE